MDYRYAGGVWWIGSWADSSWYTTLCHPYVQDDFGNLVRVHL